MHPKWLRAPCARRPGPACPRTPRSQSAASSLVPMGCRHDHTGHCAGARERLIFVSPGTTGGQRAGGVATAILSERIGGTELLASTRTSNAVPFCFFVRRPRSARSASRRPQPRHQVEDAQDLRPVAYHVTIAHLSPAQHAVPVHHEGGAPGHVAVLVEDAVGADDGAVDVAQEREGEAPGLGVGGVREGTVGADGQDRRATLPGLWVDLDQADELRRSNAAPVEAVEDEDHVLPPEGRQRDVGPRAGRQGKVRCGLTEAQACHSGISKHERMAATNPLGCSMGRQWAQSGISMSEPSAMPAASLRASVGGVVTSMAHTTASVGVLMCARARQAGDLPYRPAGIAM